MYVHDIVYTWRIKDMIMSKERWNDWGKQAGLEYVQAMRGGVIRVCLGDLPGSYIMFSKVS